MKTTEEILIDEALDWETDKKWFNEEEIRKAINKSINKWDLNFSVTNEEIIESLLEELFGKQE